MKYFLSYTKKEKHCIAGLRDDFSDAVYDKKIKSNGSSYCFGFTKILYYNFNSGKLFYNSRKR